MLLTKKQINKERKKERKKERNRSKTIPRPPTGGGVKMCDLIKRYWHFYRSKLCHSFRRRIANGQESRIMSSSSSQGEQ